MDHGQLTRIGAKFRAVGMFLPRRRDYRIQKPRVNPELYRQIGKRRIPEKHRLIPRTNYRLEAYATLRRRIAAVMVLSHDLDLSLDAPKSNVA
jgi:hypothetical protein